MTTLSTIDRTAEPAAAGRAQPRRRCVMLITWSLVAGGAETYALTVASGLDQGRYRALMCGVDQGGALEGEIARRRIPCHVMNRRDGIDLRLMWRMLQLFRSEGVDVIHTHHFNQLFYSLPAAMLLGIRVIHTEHSVEAYKQRHLRWALRAMSALCSKVTAIGADGEQTLLKKVGIPRRKLQVIRAAVDLSRFNVSGALTRDELNLNATDRVIAIVARLYPEKNHQLLLAAFRRVLNQVPTAKLLIVGEGIQKSAIERTIAQAELAGAVRMLGVRRDIPLILAATDVFVLCSDREGLPIAVLEAMAAGKPVVATAVGDLPLVVRHDETGLLVESKNEAQLADALTALLADDQRARQLGQRGRALVEREYSLTRMVQEHEVLYGAAGGVA